MKFFNFTVKKWEERRSGKNHLKDFAKSAFPMLRSGWKNIRTFVNIPAAELDLADLNSGLDLSALSAYEVTPKDGGAGGTDILPGDYIWRTSVDSFFDVFLANIPQEKSNNNYEALLVAEVWEQAPGQSAVPPPTQLGTFWNLNPQSPEPATVLVLVLGLVPMLFLKRHRKVVG